MDHVWIATEQADDGLGENKACQRTYREKYCTAFDTEIEGFLHSLVQMGAIAETAERLEALSQSDDDSISEKRDARNDTHASNGSISVGSGCHVEQDGGYTAQSLSRKGRSSAKNDFLRKLFIRSKVFQPDSDILSPSTHQKEHQTTENLADEGGNGGSGNAHTEVDDEQRSEYQIEQNSRQDALHRRHCVALKTHLIVQCERHCHEGSAEHDDA